jgi:hypothetical protein
VNDTRVPATVFSKGEPQETACAIALMIEAVSTSETSVNFYQTKWRNIPEVILI